MKLSIVGITPGNSLKEEFVLLRASEDLNLIRYALCDNTFDMNGHLSNKRRNFYWFNSLSVASGEYVVLWTGGGRPRTKTDNEGYTYHYLFWGLATKVWNNKGDKAVLFRINDLDTFAIR